MQFVVYTKKYVTKSFCFDKNIFNTDKEKGPTRSILTVSNAKKVVIVYIECAKDAMTIGGWLEIGYKLTHGGMNDVPPVWQEWLNKTFLDDKTKIWIESKNIVVMGNFYDFIRDKIMKSLPKEK